MRWAVLIGAALLVSGCDSKNLKLCEDEIKSNLKAPSTYKRISVNNMESLISIEYDADNSFGVPLRKKGMCRIDEGGEVSWLEYTS